MRRRLVTACNTCLRLSLIMPGMMPCAGTFFVWCQEHKKCLGFSLMRNHESPKTAFEVVYQRWAQAPTGKGSTALLHAVRRP